jgi:rod shape determining protein RodA
MPIDRRLISHFDWTVLLLAIGLVCLGVLTIYSATYSVTEHRASGLAMKQFYWFLFGVSAMVVAATMDYHYVDNIAYPVYGITLVLLAVVYFIGHSGSRGAALDSLRLFHPPALGDCEAHDRPRADEVLAIRRAARRLSPARPLDPF